MNTPELNTERLILRRFTEADTAAYYEFMRDEQVNTFLPNFPPQSVEDVTSWIQNTVQSYERPTGFRYALCLKTDNQAIGYVILSDHDSHDFGYCLARAFWGRGIVTEAAQAVVDLLRTTDIPFITATHDVNNPASGRVMQKIGMTYCYSYETLWQPKNFPVTFRMYQLNFDEQKDRIYSHYWDTHERRFVEEGII